MKDKKILIVEDEQIIAENLRLILNECGYETVDTAMDADETHHLFESTNYDLILMDINLGDTSPIDGIDLIKSLSKKHSFVFMYVTANADHKTVQKAKETSPAGYIVKPFMNAAIYANVELALNTLKEEEFLSYSKNGMQQKVLISKITHVEADGAYINLFTLNNEQHFLRKTLTEFKGLYPLHFIRIHKSTLINKKHIQAYNSSTVHVNNKKLTLGRSFKLSFLEEIKGITFD